MIRHNNGHRRALEKIANHSEKFGFPKPVSVSIETTLYHKGRIIAQPDVVIETEHGELHIIEYKGKGNGGLLEKARKQLEQAGWWYGRYRPDISPEKIHTYIISADDEKYKDLLRGR
jgi:hypothetical protein